MELCSTCVQTGATATQPCLSTYYDVHKGQCAMFQEGPLTSTCFLENPVKNWTKKSNAPQFMLLACKLKTLRARSNEKYLEPERLKKWAKKQLGEK